MAIIRLEPFQEADTARYRLNKLFDGMDATRVSSWTRQENWIPAVEIRETDDLVKLQVALPGLGADDIEVHVSKGAVLISGDYQPAQEQAGERLISSEFLYGSFRRVIPLDIKVKNQEAKADMRNGMLMLEIPKADDERDRVFRVSLSEPQAAQPVAVSS